MEILVDPLLETPRMEMRPLSLSDTEAVHAYRGDPEVMRYMGGADTSLDETREALVRYAAYQRMYGFSRWAMYLKETGELVGDSGLLPIDELGEFELGYRLARNFWSMGLATECGQAWLEAAFTRYGFRSMIAFADAEHVASIRVMQKLGMEFEAKTDLRGMDCVVYRINRGIYPLEPHL